MIEANLDVRTIQKAANRFRQIDMIIDRVQDDDPEWRISADVGIVEIKKVCVDALNLIQKETINVKAQLGLLSRILGRLRRRF